MVAIAVLVVLAVVHNRLPTSSSAPTLVAKAVLGLTTVIAVWTSIVVPLLPSSAVGSAVLEHVALGATAVATLAVSVAAWASR